jgi:hypothetical protein
LPPKKTISSLPVAKPAPIIVPTIASAILNEILIKSPLI